MTELEQLQYRYIKLLEQEYDKILPIAIIHGYKTDNKDILLGEILRDNIKKIKEYYEQRGI